MKRIKRGMLLIGFAGALFTLCAPVWACLWDRFTTAVEKSPFPKSHDLITGRFVHHSPEFYEWRKMDRLAKLQTEIRPEYYDDLGVSYDKLGEHDKAIETMMLKEAKYPGKYETYANLGTFYIHGGEMERGLEYIEKAISINPDAHFGREVYQLLLCKYVLKKKGNGALRLPLDAREEMGPNPGGFAKFVLEEIGPLRESANDMDEIARAQKGVEGMMRFGNFESPVLLEALGDLILAGGQPELRELAARAYLKASYPFETAEDRAVYRKKAAAALGRPAGGETPDEQLRSMEKAFHDEISRGSAMYASVRSDEMKWIATGKDAELETLRKYYPDPDISPSFINLYPSLKKYIGYAVIALIALVGMMLVFAARLIIRCVRNLRVRRGTRVFVSRAR